MINASAGATVTPPPIGSKPPISPTPPVVTTTTTVSNPAGGAVPPVSTTVTTGSATPKKKGHLKWILGGLVFVLILVGIGAGLYLQTQNQDNRQQAVGGCSDAKQETECNDECGYRCVIAPNTCQSTCSTPVGSGTPPGGNSPAPTQPPASGCKATGNSAPACDGKNPGDNLGVCTCQTSALGGGDCACIPPAGSCGSAGGTCYTGSACSGLNPGRVVVNGGGGCSNNQVCCGGPAASVSPTCNGSSTGGCSGQTPGASCNNGAGLCNGSAGSACTCVNKPGSPSPTQCNGNSDAQCIGKTPGSGSCTSGGQSGLCQGSAGGPCTCQPTSVPQTCTVGGTTYAVGQTFCASSTSRQTCTGPNQLSGVTNCGATQVCTNGTCATPSDRCDNTAQTNALCRGDAVGADKGSCVCRRTTGSLCSCAPKTGASPTANPSSNPTGGSCPNSSSTPAKYYLKFTCPNGCQRDPDGFWRCYAVRHPLSTTPVSLNGECGQVDVLSGDSDATYCGYVESEYSCDEARCQVAPPSSPTPSNPPPTASGPMCLSITLANVTRPNAGATAPRMGEAIRFTCGQVTGITNYTFRVVEPDGTIVPLTATGNASATYTISKIGQFKAQCQICTGTTANTCAAFEALN